MIHTVAFGLVLITCCVSEVYPLSQAHFRCANGRYIYDSWFCDGTVECNNDASQSDETYGCDRELCGRGKFKCTNDGACMNITVRCNNINDCSDGSDEYNCGNEIDVEQCPSREGSFICADESRCIDFEDTCDSYCNCPDCSDENEGCLQYDNYLCDKCSDTCYVTSNDTNFNFITPPSENITLTPCKACRYANSCEQKCLYIEGGKERCICDENYEVNGYNEFGQETCRNKVPYENVIIYSTPNEVKLFNLTTNETITLQKNIDCTALAGAHDYVYQAASIDDYGIIIKSSISSNYSEIIIQTESKILSIAIDWITNNIYYTTNRWIMVCSNDGRTCAKLKNCLDCRVKLSPRIGLMFWNENRVLFQSHMDGSNEQNFTVTKSRYYNTNNTEFFFDVDESSDTIFCSYFLPLIQQFRLYSDPEQIRHELYIYGGADPKFFDLDVFENEIFFSMEGDNVINRFGVKSYRSIVQIADNSTTSIKYIQVYNRLLQRTKIPNPCEKATCSLCLLRPYTPFIGLNYECKCDNIHLKDDQFSCDDESHIRSASIPDATARKRVVYDVNNPPFSWKTFLRKIRTIIILVTIALVVGLIYVIRKFDWLTKFRMVFMKSK